MSRAVVDFRDKYGNTTFSCPVCGNLADWWDMAAGVIIHAPDINFRKTKVPCNLRIGI